MQKQLEIVPRQTVFVVDDDPGIRDSLSALFDAHCVAHEGFPSAEAFLERLGSPHQGCALVDCRMPALDGVETMRRLRAEGRTLPVIMMTAHGDVDLAVRAMKAGAMDFIEKPWARQTLFDAIEIAFERDARNRSQIADNERARDLIAGLTPREQDVYAELIQGASNKVIARRLDLSPRTVEFHRARIFEKTDTDNVAELVRLAYRAGQSGELAAPS